MMYLGSRDGGIKVRNMQSMMIGTQKPGGGYCLSRALRKAETEVNVFKWLSSSLYVLCVCSRSVEDKAHEPSIEEGKWSENGVCVCVCVFCLLVCAPTDIALGLLVWEERRSLHTCRQACVIHMSNGISMATVSIMC